MKFESTPITGVFLLSPEERRDDRGFFARMFCIEEFAARGLETRVAQANISSNSRRGTLRGMHYQLGAAAEVKIVRCTQGAVWDVALDLRPDSPTFGQSFGAELTAENHRMLYIPRGCAHGFITSTEDTEVFYLVSSLYAPAEERSVRWNDPRFGIAWPATVEQISPKDAATPDFNEERNGIERLRGLI
jgi:dTDP-4-dehydrorhamnose 3,5-epimerase